MKSLKTPNRAVAAYKVHPDFMLKFLPKPGLKFLVYHHSVKPD